MQGIVRVRLEPSQLPHLLDGLLRRPRRGRHIQGAVLVDEPVSPFPNLGYDRLLAVAILARDLLAALFALENLAVPLGLLLFGLSLALQGLHGPALVSEGCRSLRRAEAREDHQFLSELLRAGPVPLVAQDRRPHGIAQAFLGHLGERVLDADLVDHSGPPRLLRDHLQEVPGGPRRVLVQVPLHHRRLEDAELVDVRHLRQGPNRQLASLLRHHLDPGVDVSSGKRLGELLGGPHHHDGRGLSILLEGHLRHRPTPGARLGARRHHASHGRSLSRVRQSTPNQAHATNSRQLAHLSLDQLTQGLAGQLRRTLPGSGDQASGGHELHDEGGHLKPHLGSSTPEGALTLLVSQPLLDQLEVLRVRVSTVRFEVPSSRVDLAQLARLFDASPVGHETAQAEVPPDIASRLWLVVAHLGVLGKKGEVVALRGLALHQTGVGGLSLEARGHDVVPEDVARLGKQLVSMRVVVQPLQVDAASPGLVSRSGALTMEVRAGVKLIQPLDPLLERKLLLGVLLHGVSYLG